MDHLDRFHLLLGKYIAKTTDVESRIDHTIGAFFQSSGPLYSEFHNWMLGRIPIGEKIALLRQIADFVAIDQDEDIRKMFRGLLSMIERRNDLAHGHYRRIVEISDAGRTEHTYLGRTHRKSKFHAPGAMKHLSPDELERELNLLDELTLPLTRLFGATFKMWPTVSHGPGAAGKTEHPGNLKELRERQRQRQEEQASRVNLQKKKDEAKEARRMAKAKKKSEAKE